MILDHKIKAFFDFVVKRESIRLSKEAGDFYPWTDDPILSEYKFTNVYRHFDRTSAELIKNFYSLHYDDAPEDILMNAALFRYFGTYEFANVVGWQTYNEFDFEGIKETARVRLANKERVFTGAYVITNQGISAPKQEVVVDTFLSGLHKAMPTLLEARKLNNWEAMASAMRKLMGFGGSGFMTKETLLDTTYTGFWPSSETLFHGHRFTFPEDWESWTPIGPGARRGISRLLGFDEPKAVKEDVCLYNILDMKLKQKDYYPQEWIPLSPHDIQFQLCEFDKYERVRLGQGRPRSKYRAS